MVALRLCFDGSCRPPGSYQVGIRIECRTRPHPQLTCLPPEWFGVADTSKISFSSGGPNESQVLSIACRIRPTVRSRDGPRATNCCHFTEQLRQRNLHHP